MGYCNCSLIGNLLWFYCAVHGIPLPYLFDDCIEFWWKIDALIDNNKVLWFSTTMKSHKWKDQTLFSGRCHNNRKSTNRLCSKWSQANFLFVELRNSNEDNLRTHRAYNVAAHKCSGNKQQQRNPLHTWKKRKRNQVCCLIDGTCFYIYQAALHETTICLRRVLKYKIYI